MGDPAGIGPELAAKLLADPQNYHKANIYVLADLSEVRAAEKTAGVSIPIVDVAGPEGVQVLDDGTAPSEPIPLGKESKEAGERAMHQLKRAVAMANRNEVDAIVFTPLNKTSMHWGGMNEEDELQWFAKYLSHNGMTSEINITGDIWTARVTSHVGIKDVASKVTKKGVLDTIELLNRLLYVSLCAILHLFIGVHGLIRTDVSTASRYLVSVCAHLIRIVARMGSSAVKRSIRSSPG